MRSLTDFFFTRIDKSKMSGKKPTKIEKEVKRCKDILDDDALCNQIEQKSREEATKECDSITSEHGKEQCMQKSAGFKIKRKTAIQKNKKRLLPKGTNKEESKSDKESYKKELKRVTKYIVILI